MTLCTCSNTSCIYILSINSGNRVWRVKPDSIIRIAAPWQVAL
ncbi:hypothetical protein [Shewanella putrefaciens]